MKSFFFSYPCLASQGVGYVWEYINQVINTAIGLFVPSIHVRSKQQAKWFTPTVQHNLKCVHTLRSYRSAPSQSKKVINLRQLRLIYNTLIMSESKSSYETALIQQFVPQTMLVCLNTIPLSKSNLCCQVICHLMA